jgi:hypothetical protein
VFYFRDAKVFASDSKGDKVMRCLRRFCAIVMLASLLAVPAFAGDIECPAVTSQPPQVAGDMPNGIESSEPVTVAIVSLLMALF